MFENSDHVVASFLNDGTPVEDARNWYGQGCVTPILPTKVDHNGSEGKGAVNVALILDLTLHRGVSQITGKKVGIDVGDPREFKTFDELYEAFKKQYKYIVNRVLWLGTLAQSVEPLYLRFPFNSSSPGRTVWKKVKIFSSRILTIAMVSATGPSWIRPTLLPPSSSLFTMRKN